MLYITKYQPALCKKKEFLQTWSSSCRAGSTYIPDPLSPLLPIVHRPRQVFRTNLFNPAVYTATDQISLFHGIPCFCHGVLYLVVIEKKKVDLEKIFGSSSAWDFWILKSRFNDTVKYTKQHAKKPRHEKIKEKHSVYKKSVCISREGKKK